MKIWKFLTLLAALLLSINIKAECVKGDCDNGKGIWLENNGYSYVGEFKNGRKHGQGVDRFGNESGYRIYNGSFINGSYDGDGVLYINNGQESPYIFGTFKNGNLAEGTEVLMKFENGVAAYYKAETGGRLKIIEEKTVDLFCTQNPTYIGCIDKFVWNNKEAILGLIAVGYISSVVDSNNNLSFNDISHGIKMLADITRKRHDEHAQEFADRVVKKLGIPN